MSGSSSSSSNGSSHWPTILLFIAAIGVPGSAALAFGDKVSKNPWQAVAIGLLYEIAVIFIAFLRKVWQHLEEEWRAFCLRLKIFLYEKEDLNSYY